MNGETTTVQTPDTETRVRREILVDVPVAHAFDVFTRRFDLWWPRGHHIGKVEMRECVLEERAGGRWFERGIDGSECDWGSVLAFTRPSHVALAWHLDGTWSYDPDPTRASRVDVTFSETHDGKTRVVLEHSQLDRHVKWEQLKTGICGREGWSGLLEMFAAKAGDLLVS